jgi:predicted MPP superfamily phosphohydrolase
MQRLRNCSLILLTMLSFTDTIVLSANDSTRQKRDITFFVSSDTHIGRPDKDSLKASRTMIEAMHAAPGKKLPRELGGGTIRDPLGVVLTGDLTDDNRLEQWNQFDSIWSANGDGEIRYPVFEGWGNHDFHAGRKEVRAAMLERHQKRAYPITIAPGDGAHYSWDWNDVHLVHLNLYPGMEGGLSKYSPKNNNPRRSLEFLQDDLQEQVGNSKRPVILFFHYGFDSNGGTAWVDSEREAFYKVIRPYRVIALFVGHSHVQGYEKIETGEGGPSVDVFMSDDALSAGTSKKNGFYVVNIQDDEMLVAERLVPRPGQDKNPEWGFVRRVPLQAP